MANKLLIALLTAAGVTAPSLDAVVERMTHEDINPSGFSELISPDSAYAWQLGQLPHVDSELYNTPSISEAEFQAKKQDAIDAFLDGRKYELQKDHASARPHYQEAKDIFKFLGVRDHEYGIICTRLGMVEMRLWEKGQLPIHELVDDYIDLKRYGDECKKFDFDLDAKKGSADYNARRNAAIVYNLLGNLGEVLIIGKPRTTAVNANICADYREAERLFPEGTFYKNVSRCSNRGY